ncbi:hypothetical protein BV20DRAFT_656450 [Pilatotrama ljubarskyi]|nr:hypothetical protein BV20DRAFT_656450 [Pilatotrama ljubarskyi]
MVVGLLIPLSALVLVASMAYGCIEIRAASSDWPMCSNSAYSWMDSERGQTPCTTLQDLLSSCSGAIESSTPAEAESVLQGSPCACNTVLYSLWSACGICANDASFQVSWTVYSTAFGCSSLAIQQYPHSVASDTSIPAWAYMRLAPLSGVQFDVQAAQSIASQHQPDSTTSGSYAPRGPMSAPTDGTASLSSGIASTHLTAPATTTFPAFPTTESSSTDGSISTSQSLKFEGASTSSGTKAEDSPAASPPADSSGSLYWTSSTGQTHSTIASLLPSSQQTASPPDATANPGPARSTNSAHLGAIIGGVVAGIAGAAIAIFLVLYIVRRRRRSERFTVRESSPFEWWRRQRSVEQLPADGPRDEHKVVERIQEDVSPSRSHPDFSQEANDWTDDPEASPPPYSVACAMPTIAGGSGS